jgi:hypothetical protein
LEGGLFLDGAVRHGHTFMAGEIGHTTVQILLDYVVRYQERRGSGLSAETLDRSLSGAYPLFRYLFPSSGVCHTAIEELTRAGWLRDSVPASAPNWKVRLRRTVLECVKFQALEIVDRIPLRHIGEIAESAVDDENVEPLNERLKFLGHTALTAAAPLAKQYAKALIEINSDTEKLALCDLITRLAGNETD